MKKLSILLVAAVAFACSTTTTNDTTNQETIPNDTEEHVEEYSGENITPQVNLDSGSNERLEVDVEDTVTSAQSVDAEIDYNTPHL